MSPKRCCFNHKIWRATFLIAKAKYYCYPRDILQSNLNRAKDIINNRGMIGELGTVDDSIIHFANASHIVIDMRFNVDDLECDVEILETPNGVILKRFLDANPKLVIFKPRGIGSTDIDPNSKTRIVRDTYRLITVDAELKENNG